MRKIDAKNLFCIHCAVELAEFICASKLIWNEEEHIATPVCDYHFAVLQEVDRKEDNIYFYKFSDN